MIPISGQREKCKENKKKNLVTMSGLVQERLPLVERRCLRYWNISMSEEKMSLYPRTLFGRMPERCRWQAATLFLPIATRKICA